MQLPVLPARDASASQQPASADLCAAGQVSINMLQGMVVTATALTGLNTYAVCFVIPMGERLLLP